MWPSGMDRGRIDGFQHLFMCIWGFCIVESTLGVALGELVLLEDSWLKVLVLGMGSCRSLAGSLECEVRPPSGSFAWILSYTRR